MQQHINIKYKALTTQYNKKGIKLSLILEFKYNIVILL